MGTGEDGTRAKASKPSSSVQETPPPPPVTPSYPDWSSSMQAYYGAAAAAAPPFFAPTVASPSPHAYMWGTQHPFMPPYGTPAYPAVYPAGGVYAHPNMATTPGTIQTTVELEGKVIHGKDRASMKKSKGTSGIASMGGKAGENGKMASGSGNDGASESADSGSEGSSDASDENTNEQELSSKKRSFNQMLADGANAQNSMVPGKPIVSVPATNLNIGMDLWNASPAGVGTVKMRPNSAGVSSVVAREAIMPDSQWVQNGSSYGQDERELKKQKRKQSNRESARRSRLRKQAECEELQQRVEALINENRALRDELQTVSKELDKLRSENNSIKEGLTDTCGPNALSNLKDSNSNPVNESCGDEGNS